MVCLHIAHTVTGHAWLSGHTSGDQDDLGARERFFEAGSPGLVAGDLALRIDVAYIRGNAYTYISCCGVANGWKRPNEPGPPLMS